MCRQLTALLAVGVFTLSGCSSDDGNPASAPSPAASSAAPTEAPSASESPADVDNACPAEGCIVTIVGINKDDNGELIVTLSANFAPDAAHNQFHLYWNRFTAQQVGADAQARFGVAQGEWAPTADNPYTTADAASVTKRDGSEQLCVTAGDADDKVINADLNDCYDITGLV